MLRKMFGKQGRLIYKILTRRSVLILIIYLVRAIVSSIGTKSCCLDLLNRTRISIFVSGFLFMISIYVTEDIAHLCSDIC